MCDDAMNARLNEIESVFPDVFEYREQLAK